MNIHIHRIAIAIFVLSLSSFVVADAPARHAAELLHAEPPRSRHIGKVYHGAGDFQCDGPRWRGLARKRPEPRKRKKARPKAIDLIGLKPTDVVADIGAGTGYFSFRIAPKVPQGKVLAEDIEPAMLDDIHKNAERAGVKNVSRSWGRRKIRSCRRARWMS